MYHRSICVETMHVLGLSKKETPKLSFHQEKSRWLQFFFSALFFPKEKIGKWIFVFKTETKQVLTFNLEMSRHINKNMYSLASLQDGNLAHDL